MGKKDAHVSRLLLCLLTLHVMVLLFVAFIARESIMVDRYRVTVYVTVKFGGVFLNKLWLSTFHREIDP